MKTIEIDFRIEKAAGKKASFVYDIAPVIGDHGGVGAISISYLES